MTYVNILASFETEINKINDTLNKPATDDSLYCLNQAVGKFVKLRFNGDAIHHTGYEQTEKRRQDLIKLYTCKTMKKFEVSEQPSYHLYRVDYPEDFLYALHEDVVITGNDRKNKINTSVFECTTDSFMYRVNNSLTDFHYKRGKARPIRVRNSFGCYLLTDKNYLIYEYTLGYLRKPKEITLEKPFEEYDDFEDIIMTEIIKMAAQMYLENQKDERYQTIVQEVSTQE